MGEILGWILSYIDYIPKNFDNSLISFIAFLLFGFIISFSSKKLCKACWPLYNREFIKHNIKVDKEIFNDNLTIFCEILLLFCPFFLYFTSDYITIHMVLFCILGMIIYDILFLKLSNVSLRNIFNYIKLIRRYRKELNKVGTKDINW